jgi:hypothetical protein
MKLFRLQFDHYARGCFAIICLRSKMDVIFSESRSSLSPFPSEGYPNGVPDRGFPSVIRPNEDGRLPEFDVEVLNRPEILYSKPR